jgi:hypothetical protein
LAQRGAILSKLLLRNRLVAILRIGVPAIGIVVFAALALQIYVGNLVAQYGISGVFIDRGNLVVETPSFEASGADGTLYSMAAEAARASLTQPDELVLTGATLNIAPPGAPFYRAIAKGAIFSTTTQELRIDGSLEVAGESGMQGTIDGLMVNMQKRSALANGAVQLAFPDGTAFNAASMSYDSEGRTWHFTKVNMTLIDTPRDTTP